MSRPAYALRLDRPLDKEAARIVNGQVRHARRALKQGTDEGVHSARKALKRARAALRLVRGGLRPERFRDLDRQLRDAGRRTGPPRDAFVVLSLTEEVAHPAAEPLREALVEQRRRAWDALDASGGVDALRADLSHVRLVPEDVPGLDALALCGGLRRTYASGRRRLARAAERPTPEALHDWRKRVKQLGYQLRLLTPAWPLPVRASARTCDALGEALGRDHDLAEWAHAARQLDLPKKTRRLVRAHAEEERATLLETVWPLGVRLYAEEADPFASRHVVYLATALAEAGGAPLDGLPLPAPPDRLLVPA